MRKAFGALGVALALVLAALPSTASAQTAQVGQVVGDVRDATGAILPGATVTLTSEARGFSRAVVTDSFGKFMFPVVPPGKYDLTVTLSHFEVKKVTNNLVEAEKTTGVSVMLKLATVEEKTTVIGETPIVDPTNQTVQTRLRDDEFQKMPFNRSYQALLGIAPGVVGSGNANTHGALSSNNLFLFDGVNTTDPTSGTFGNSMNYEAIQEIIIRTATASAEFGRATGAIVDVVSKSGTNQFQGSMKYIFTNDQWNQQNTTTSEVAPNASLARTKFDKLNPVYSGTIGGPIRQDRAWFFAAFEDARNTSPQQQTNAAPGNTPETYQQTTNSPYFTARVTAELAPAHHAWFKVQQAPTNGFLFDYYNGFAAERSALTKQDQGGRSYAGSYTGVFAKRWTLEAMAAHSAETITVSPFQVGATNGGAAIFDENDGRWYNGATYDGYVKRPRTQATAAATYFANLGGHVHSIKAGMDWQMVRSENSFKFPTGTEFDVIGFDPVTRSYTPDLRFDYDTTPSKSRGQQLAFYGRDQFQAGSRATIEAGLRLDRQTAHSDVNALTLSTWALAPRVSASVAVDRQSRTLLVGSYGRFHDGVLQGFSDTFAAVPQQTNYNLYQWNGTAYDFVSAFAQGASTFAPNTAISPRRMDEFTGGVEHKVNNAFGVSARAIVRTWGNFIDDVRSFNADGSVNRVVQNITGATRTYRGVEFGVDRRFANHWSASANYTYGRTRGNHFSDDFSALGDFVNESCQTIDPGVGDANGVFPCADVQANLAGTPTYDRPHMVKFNAAYSHPMGRFDLTTGVVGSVTSKATYTESRTVQVLLPGTLSASGQTLTYNYEPLGTDRIPGLAKNVDASAELTRRLGRANLGMKFDVFNVFNLQEKIAVNNTSFCASTATPACATAVANYGTATVRSAFQAPRTFRFSFVVRY